MKKTRIKAERFDDKQLGQEDEATDESKEEVADIISIQEFIELKKLQNRVLEKMLKSINPSKNQNKPNNK